MATPSANTPLPGPRTTDDAGNAMEPQGADTMAGTIGRARNRADALIESTADSAQEGIDRLSAQASDAVDRAATSAEDTTARVADATSEYASRFGAHRGERLDQARAYISAHPLRSIGIAAVAGYVVARMLR